MLFEKNKPALYLVTDRRNYSETKILNITEAAIRGGVDVVQFRDKESTDDDFLEMAKKMCRITQYYNVPLIINDRLEMAKKVNAAGVHVGQKDTPIELVRKIIGQKMILGYSVDHIDQLKRIENIAVDYIGLGPIFGTKTKKDSKPPLGLKRFFDIAQKSKFPVIAIGGITAFNIEKIMTKNICGVAVIGALMDAFNPEKAAIKLKEMTYRIRREYA